MQVIKRKDAIAQGLKYYFTGTPCKHGHLDIRFVTGGCKTCQNLSATKQYWKDPEKHKASNRDYFQQDHVKHKNKLRQRELYKNNPELFRAISSACRADRMQRIVSWSQLDEIKEFYKHCPEGHEVDHIVPLLGKNVSGLHVIENLQYLLMSKNRAKHNKFEIE